MRRTPTNPKITDTEVGKRGYPVDLQLYLLSCFCSVVVAGIGEDDATFDLGGNGTQRNDDQFEAPVVTQ